MLLDVAYRVCMSVFIWLGSRKMVLLMSRELRRYSLVASFRYHSKTAV